MILLLATSLFSQISASTPFQQPSWQKPQAPLVNDPSKNFHPANSNINNRSNMVNNGTGLNKEANSVFSNTIDKSKVHNSEFLKEMNLDKTSKGLDEWLNSAPEAREMINKVFLNYGVLAPEKSGYSNGVALPSPQYLLQTVEESLAIHASFKEFLRRLLENVQQYLTQCSLMLAETVIRLERKYEQILSTMDSLNGSTSSILKTNYSKHLFDLKSDAEGLIKRFHGLKDWKVEVEGKIQKSL